MEKKRTRASRALVPTRREIPDALLIHLIAKHGFLLGRPIRRAWWERGRKKGSFRLRTEKSVSRRSSYLLVDPKSAKIVGRMRRYRYHFRDGMIPDAPTELHLFLMASA